ncbi:MAG TPA: nitroreductase [Hanamia sp.]|nr:nitroreductase [Hanamia sp.]
MENKYDTTLFNEIIQNRRSVFPYQFEKGKRIPDEIIWQILENANRAPTHKMTEPWRFKVFTGEGLQHFSKLQSDIYTRYAGEKFKENKHLNLINYPLMSSHVIAIGMKRNQENIIPEIEEIMATAFAIENMYLTVAAYGLGGYLSTGGITYLDEAKSYFDLKHEDKLIGFFYVGYPAHVSESLTKRQPIKEKVKWVLE